MKLNPQWVSGIFFRCMFNEGEDTSNAVKVPGIMTNVGFHPVRLEAERAQILEMIEELPIEFRSEDNGGGGGWSFLNLCTTKDGDLWTGEQRVCEQLYLLAAGIGKARILLPREMWAVLPGGVPYIGFD